MVRRCAGTLEDVVDLHTLAAAFHRAATGRRGQAEVQRFEACLLPNLARLASEVRAGTAPRSVFRRFQIRDPKPRVIHAPVFEDRVVHHALMAVVGPTLDRALVDDTFACRVGKGSLAAVLRAQHHLRRFGWYVKIDVRKYFASIPHGPLVAAVAKKLRDRRLQALLTRVVDGFHDEPGRGLPIGSLTSQHLANAYLAPLDRWLANDRRVRGQVRYMDDMVWWCEGAEDARATLAEAGPVVEALGLTLKGPGFVQRSRAGLSFLGFRVYPGVLKLSRRRQRRYREARARWEAAFEAGEISAGALQRCYDAAFAITAHADAAGFRRAELARRPAPEV